MSFVFVFGLFALGAYALQTIFALRQIKDFNETYKTLRRQGKVAIGRRAGKIKAGTLVMFAGDDQGLVLDCAAMQGVTVLARFKRKDEFVGEDLHYLDKYHPVASQQNKLMLAAIEDARELYLRVEANNYTEEQPISPFAGVLSQLQMAKLSFQNRIRKDVK